MNILHCRYLTVAAIRSWHGEIEECYRPFGPEEAAKQSSREIVRA